MKISWCANATNYLADSSIGELHGPALPARDFPFDCVQSSHNLDFVQISQMLDSISTIFDRHISLLVLF